MTYMWIISQPSRFCHRILLFCHVLVTNLSSYTRFPVTGFTHEYKIVNLNKCITSHAKLLVSHVVGASSLALGWYEANKYLLLSLLDPVTLGTASPFCDFYAYVWWAQIIPVPAHSWFWQVQILFTIAPLLDWSDHLASMSELKNNEGDMTVRP